MSFTITKTQLNNLAKLSAYLRSLPKTYEHFDMNDYARDENDISVRYASDIKSKINECGTSACACGHGPMAGIKPLKHERWDDYATRAFGASQDGDTDDLWSYMFGPEHDNDPHAAADRIDNIVTSASRPIETVEVTLP